MNTFIVQAIEQNTVRKINKKKSNNIAKQLRIASATTGTERENHLLRADKLLSRYAPQETEVVDINN
jgi:hypothetical protein